MTKFAGTLTGQVIEEQLFINNQWVTYRTRGGAVQQDAFFAPTTQTPYTDDTTHPVPGGPRPQHELRDDLHEPPDARHPRGLRPVALRVGHRRHAALSRATSTHPDRCGSASTTSATTQNPGSNFVIATLEGGKRDYDGLDLVFRKRYSNNWQALLSYTYNRARRQHQLGLERRLPGRVLWLDPRAPNAYGRQPGSITHVFKVAGRTTPPSACSARRQLPVELGRRSPAAPTLTSAATCRSGPGGGGLRVHRHHRYLDPAGRGRYAAPIPSWGQLDLRAKYKKTFGGLGTEFFVDIFNVVEQPGLDPHPGSRRGQRRHRLRRADPLPRSAPVLPRGSPVVLVRRRARGFVGPALIESRPFFVRLTAVWLKAEDTAGQTLSSSRMSLARVGTPLAPGLTPVRGLSDPALWSICPARN